MTPRHALPPAARQYLANNKGRLAAAVPDNMQAGLLKMLSIARERGLSEPEAYGAVTMALRAQQAPLNPRSKAWLVLEAGVMWLERRKAAGTPS